MIKLKETAIGFCGDTALLGAALSVNFIEQAENISIFLDTLIPFIKFLTVSSIGLASLIRVYRLINKNKKNGSTNNSINNESDSNGSEYSNFTDKGQKD
jgi:hypothetical protein